MKNTAYIAVFLRCDPKGTQFEPLLAHFEQLRQMYEIKEKEETHV